MAGTEQDIATTMWAVRLHGPGGPGDLLLERIETPQPRAGEALVRVHAAAITPDELSWPTDRLPATPSYEMLGRGGRRRSRRRLARGEGAGVGVDGLRPGRRGGGVRRRRAPRSSRRNPRPSTTRRRPPRRSQVSARGRGCSITVSCKDGQRVLIHGAAGGVGHLATQLARRRGAYVIGTASAASAERALEFGAHEVLDPATVRVRGLARAGRPRLRHGRWRRARPVVGGHPPGRQAGLGRRRAARDLPGAQDRDDLLRRRAEPRAAHRARDADRCGRRYVRRSIRCSRCPRHVGAFERSMAPGKRGKVVIRVEGTVASMVSQDEKAVAFRALHAGEAFVIPNPWDAGSARVLEALGFEAVATTSSGFAFTLGRLDGGVTLGRGVRTHDRDRRRDADLPVSVDLENGYGPDPEQRRARDRPGRRGRRGRRLDRGLRPGWASLRAAPRCRADNRGGRDGASDSRSRSR